MTVMMDAAKIREFSDLREMRSAIITNETQFYEISNLLWPKLQYLDHIVSVRSSKQLNRSSTIAKLKYLSESLIKKTKETNFLRSEITLLRKTRDSLNEFIIQQAAIIAGFNNQTAVERNAHKTCQQQNPHHKKKTMASKALKKAKTCRRKKNLSSKENAENQNGADSNLILCDQFLDGEAVEDESFNEGHGRPANLKVVEESMDNFRYNVPKIGIKSEPLSDDEQEYPSSSAIFSSDFVSKTTQPEVSDSNNSAPSLIERSIPSQDSMILFNLDELFTQPEEKKIMCGSPDDNIFNCISSQLSNISY